MICARVCLCGFHDVLMDQIHALHVFARTVEPGCFMRVANWLALRRGAVTKRIQSFEARVRVDLLNRAA